MVRSGRHIVVPVVLLTIKNALNLLRVLCAVAEDPCSFLLLFFNVLLCSTDFFPLFVHPFLQLESPAVVGPRRDLLLSIESVYLGFVHPVAMLDSLLSDSHHLRKRLRAHFIDRCYPDFVEEVPEGVPCEYRPACARGWFVFFFCLNDVQFNEGFSRRRALL